MSFNFSPFHQNYQKMALTRVDARNDSINFSEKWFYILLSGLLKPIVPWLEGTQKSISSCPVFSIGQKKSTRARVSLLEVPPVAQLVTAGAGADQANWTPMVDGRCLATGVIIQFFVLLFVYCIVFVLKGYGVFRFWFLYVCINAKLNKKDEPHQHSVPLQYSLFVFIKQRVNKKKFNVKNKHEQPMLEGECSTLIRIFHLFHVIPSAPHRPYFCSRFGTHSGH